MLEKMDDFFNSRTEGYEEHMLNNIESAKEFYPFTAKNLPVFPGAKVLDLGCGTGLELDYYFKITPSAKITGIDLASGMLEILKNKYPHKDMDLICGSYFDVPFGEEVFDAAVSVESLHHFSEEEKIFLYSKIRNSLKSGSKFILTDYFSLSDDEEIRHRNEFEKLKYEQNTEKGCLYHFDIPFTPEHEIKILTEAGFSSVKILKNWGATFIIESIK